MTAWDAPVDALPALPGVMPRGAGRSFAGGT